MNCYQKAEKLSKLPIYTKESFTLQHKKENYWDYIDFKVARIEHNNYDQVRNYFERLLVKYENKPFSEFRYKVINNSKFKHNKFFRRWSLDYLRDLEKGFTRYRGFDYEIENGLLIKQHNSYSCCHWQPYRIATDGCFDIKRKGVNLILKDGFFYKPSKHMFYSFSVSDKKYDSTLRRYVISFYTVQKAYDRQLNKKELKYFGLTNINGTGYHDNFKTN